MELCRRMSALGALSESQIAETAMHLGRREMLGTLLHAGRSADFSDRDARALMEAIMPRSEPEAAPQRRIYVVGGDYFSQSQYEDVRQDDDAIFSRIAVGQDTQEFPAEPPADTEQFYTETLARIYLDQGYRDEAVNIYSKLSLRYPEKSVYFAALIEEINTKDN